MIVCLISASFMRNYLNDKGSYQDFVQFTHKKRQTLLGTLNENKKNADGMSCLLLSTWPQAPYFSGDLKKIGLTVWGEALFILSRLWELFEYFQLISG